MRAKAWRDGADCSHRRRRGNARPRPGLPITTDPRRSHWQSLRGHGARARRSARARHLRQRHSRRAARSIAPHGAVGRTIVGAQAFASSAPGIRCPMREASPRRARFSICLRRATLALWSFSCSPAAARRWWNCRSIPASRSPICGELYRLLVDCGAPIDEINAVRKHLSAVKGGRLAAAAPAAMKLTLGVTDVPAGRESALASGPTLPDPTTVADACRVIERYALMPQIAAAIRARNSATRRRSRKPPSPAIPRLRARRFCCCSE